ncbi:hypothetical protein GCM10023322_60350 [Rugosimonospora acidiphila]|uniref:Uncharacterized protein n=1 Tax=Rugosimonospora acidiphila TaxID=556531 RepID=A0ABP9SHQ3_9ACTN
MSGDASPVGLIGVLSVGTRGPAGPGEVIIKIRGGSECYLAWSPSPIPKGASVLVVESRGARALGVVQWSDTATPQSDVLE